MNIGGDNKTQMSKFRVIRDEGRKGTGKETYRLTRVTGHNRQLK